MKFEKFTILNPKDQNVARETEVEMLINLDHIISVKPIRIASPDRLLNGFWIRTSNGKKYKATKIPDLLLKTIGEEYASPINVNYDDVDGDEAYPQ
jgi:hypothetical protein